MTPGATYDSALVDALRPRTRGDCERGPRPCPWVACRYHLAIERTVPARGVHDQRTALRALEAAADVDLWSLPETCALDVAELGEHTQSEVAEVAGVPLERIAAAERSALFRMSVTARWPE